MFYYFLLPNFIEKLLTISNNHGNMALYGVFLDLYYKRNLFYISLLSLFFFYFFYIHIGVVFCGITFYSFFQSYMKWKKVIYCNLTF
jgi:hypothetical protein